jgi:MraZ protein
VPKRYLQKAGISQNVRFIGVRNTIEMWDIDELESQFVDAEEFSQLFEKMMSEPESQTPKE